MGRPHSDEGAVSERGLSSGPLSDLLVDNWDSNQNPCNHPPPPQMYRLCQDGVEPTIVVATSGGSIKCEADFQKPDCTCIHANVKSKILAQLKHVLCRGGSTCSFIPCVSGCLKRGNRQSWRRDLSWCLFSALPAEL